MSEWKEYKLGEIITLQRGYDLPRAKMKNGEIPVAGSNGIIGYHDQYTTEGPGITIGRSGNIGVPKFYKGNFWAHNTVLYVKDFHGNDEKFVYYLLQTIDFTQFNTGSAVPSLNRNHVYELNISIPLLSEQKRIASILGSLDDKIDLLHRENETLEAMAETLFRKWFIENTESSVKQGYLGDYILDTIGGEWGKEVSQDDFVKPVKCIRGTDIAALNTGIPSKTPLRFIKKSKYEKIKPLDGDIIIEISGGTESQSTGRSLYINKEVCGLFDYPIIFSNFCRLLRVEKKYSYFVYCYFQYLYRQDEFFNIENGSSGIKNLDYKTLLYNNQYQMPTNKNFAANFSEIVTPYFTKIDKNKLQICNLMKMRDTLLPRLIFNKIKI